MQPERPYIRYYFDTKDHFGTYSVLSLYAPDSLSERSKANRCFDEILNLFSDISAAASPTMQDSDCRRFGEAVPGSVIHVSHHTANLVRSARIVSDLTGGLYDPTVGPLVDLWGFSAEERNLRFRNGTTEYGADKGAPGFIIPSEADIHAALELVGISSVVVSGNDESGFDLVKHGSQVEVEGQRLFQHLDLGGIAKGYAIDGVRELLTRYGYHYGTFNCGGSEILVLHNPNAVGDAEQSDWRVSIQHPLKASGSICMYVSACDTTVTTSSDCQHLRRNSSRCYSHLIDPRTGYPAAYLDRSSKLRVRSAILIGSCATAADALATAICCMEPGQALEFVRQPWFTDQYRSILIMADGDSEEECLYVTDLLAGDFEVCDDSCKPLSVDLLS